MLKEKEASLLVVRDDTVASLEATIARLEQELQASQPMQPSQEKMRPQDLPLQQRWTTNYIYTYPSDTPYSTCHTHHGISLNWYVSHVCNQC